MARSHVFVALIEVRPRPECELLDPAEDAGAAVRCYLTADREATARHRLVAALDAARLDLVETEWLVRHDQVEWDVPDDPDAAAAIAEARGSGEVVFGAIHTWGPEDDDADPE